MTEETIIHVKNITKKFNNKVVLEDISLDIPKGKAITFIGHNGTGKSTFLKIIAKLITVNDGSVDYTKDLLVSYIPEHFPKLNISAESYLLHMGMIAGLSEKEAERKCNEFFEMFFMSSMKETKLKHLSKGTLQKVSVIQALLVKADVLMLDEPLSGQDIDSQNVFIKMINELKAQGMTVIMSCHEKFLMNRISDIIYEIKDGQLMEHKVGSGKFAEYDTMIFDISNYKGALVRKNGKEELEADEKYKEYILKLGVVEDKQHSIKITAETNQSNAIIREMLSGGALIKEMYHENI